LPDNQLALPTQGELVKCPPEGGLFFFRIIQCDKFPSFRTSRRGTMSFRQSLIPIFYFVLAGIALPFALVTNLNSSNLSMGADRYYHVLLFSLAVVFVVSAVVLGLFGRYRDVLAKILVFLATYFWIQSNFLVGNYGFFLGGEVDWDKNSYLLVPEVLIATVLILTVYRKWSWWQSNLLFLCFLLPLLSALQLFSSSPESLDSSDPEDQIKYVINDRGLLDFSREQTNVIVLIVDSFQSDVFQELYSEGEVSNEVFDGFTFFRNATSSFPKTYASVPSILSSRAFDNSQPISEFIRESYLEKDSLPKVLTLEGYDVRLQPYAPRTMVADPKLLSNIVSAEGGKSDISIAFNRDITELVNMTLFRMAPSFLKPKVYYDGEFIFSDLNVMKSRDVNECEADPNYSLRKNTWDLRWLDEVLSCTKAIDLGPTFRFYHLQGTHEPIWFDRDLNYVGVQKINRETYKGQAIGVLHMLDVFFRELRRVGVYDNSLIIVVGDHGLGEHSIGISRSFPDLPENSQSQNEADLVNDQIIRGGLPLVLAKPLGAEGDLRLDDRPVQLADIPATVFDQLGIDAELPGTMSFYQIGVDEQRLRHHRHYSFDGWDIDYILPLEEYLVSGFSWYTSSWSSSSADLTRVAIENFEGLLVTFFTGGNSDRFIGSGWGEPTRAGRQVLSSKADLDIVLRSDSVGLVHNLILEYRSIDQTSVPVELFLNSEKIDSWQAAPGHLPVDRIVLLPSLLAGTNKLELRLLGKAQRFEVESLRLVPAEVYQIGETVNFEEGGNASYFLTEGWSLSEKWGTWTDASYSEIVLPLTTPVDGDLALSFEFRPYIKPKKPNLKFSVIVNGSQLESLTVDKEGLLNLEMTIPRNSLSEADRISISFDIEDPKSPKEMGYSIDGRKLGLGMKQLTVSRIE
jgi:hypothetical protein